MARMRPPRLQSEHALRMLRQVAGSNKPFIILLTLVLFLASGISGNALWGIVQRLLSAGSAADFSWLAHLVGLLTLPAFLFVLWLWARSANEQVHVTVHQDDQPPKVRALILFLSPPGRDKELIERIRTEDTGHQLANSTARALFQGPWRMPLEAMAYHQERLRHVVVIPSRDSEKSRGTHHDLQSFRELTGRLLAPDLKKTFDVLDLPTLLKRAEGDQAKEYSRHQHAVNRLPAVLQHPLQALRSWWVGETAALTPQESDYAQGVDFEDAKQLVEAIELAHDLLRARDIAAYDILIDITGGQKPPTVAGAAVSLAEGRRFQYVSMHDYKVLTYDVTYLA